MNLRFSRCAPALMLTVGLVGTQLATTPTILTHADAIDSDYHVAKYHLTTKDGWSNDLQTISWNEEGKYYDIYFLHSQTADDPNEAGHQNWYHTTTKDFVHFTPQNVAIEADGPDKPYTWSSAWTGTIITNNGQIKGVPKGAKVAYFSGLEKHDGGSQNIWAAYSTDNGKTFSHVLNDAKPVIDHSWDWTSANHGDERDPAVFYWNGKLLMYAAEGNEIGVYQSTDGINWTKADKNGRSKVLPVSYFKGLNSEDSFPVECPAVRTMKMPNGQVKTVLFYGAKAPKNGQTTGTYYIVGHLNKDGLFEPETDAKRLDQGSDYYGANFSGSEDLSKPDKSIKSMGWIGNWAYTAAGVHNDQDAKSEFTKHLGSYSVARDLTLNNDMTISQKPITGKAINTKTYKNVSKDHPINNDNKPYTNGTDTNGPRYNLYDVANLDVNKEYDLDFFNTKGAYKGRIYFDILQGKDYIKFNYDPSNGKYVVSGYSGELDNSRTGQGASSYYYDGMLGDGHGYSADSGVKDQIHIKIKALTDKNSVEIFFPNGQSYTVARFNSSDKQDFKIFTEDPTGGNRVNITQSDLGYTLYAKSFYRQVRTIHFVDNHGKKVANDVVQALSGLTKGYEQDVTGTYHDTTHEDRSTLGEVKVPDVPGYTPNISVVPKLNMKDGLHLPAEVTVVYTPINQSQSSTSDSQKDDKPNHSQGGTSKSISGNDDKAKTGTSTTSAKDDKTKTGTPVIPNQNTSTKQIEKKTESSPSSKKNDQPSSTATNSDKGRNEKTSQSTTTQDTNKKSDTSTSNIKNNQQTQTEDDNQSHHGKDEKVKSNNTSKQSANTAEIKDQSQKQSQDKRKPDATFSDNRTNQRDAVDADVEAAKQASEGTSSTPSTDASQNKYSTAAQNNSIAQPGTADHTTQVKAALNKEKKHKAIALLPQTGDKEGNWLILTIGSIIAAIGIFFTNKFKKKD